MTESYHEGQRALQDRFDTRRLADRLASAAGDTFSAETARFVEGRDMFFIASTDADGAPDCSYKGGDPGFVGAIAAVSVRARAIFPNCRRYVHEYRKVASSPFVPHEGSEPPVPDWKRDPWFEGTLPAGDPALDPDRPSAPSIPQL